jgi:hypothetical protein
MTRGPRPGRPAVTSRKYADTAPDVTGSGIGKCYPGFRIFYSMRTGGFEHINAEYETRPALPEEVLRFRQDVTRAAKGDAKVAEFLRAHPELAIELPEPKTEGPMGEPAPGPGPQNQ